MTSTAYDSSLQCCPSSAVSPAGRITSTPGEPLAAGEEWVNHTALPPGFRSMTKGSSHVHCHGGPHPAEHGHRLLAPPALVRHQHVGQAARHLHARRALSRE